MPLALLAAWAWPQSLAHASQPGKVSLPAPADQRFQVFYGDMGRDLSVAEIHYRLQQDEDRYEISTRGQAVGMVALFYSGDLVQKSVGRIGPEGLLPERYSERRGKRAERVIRFDHARKVMIGTGDPPEVTLPPGTQDRLSVVYQLGLMARREPKRFQAGYRFSVPLASMKEINLPTITVVGPASVKGANGPIPALHVSARNAADPKDPVIEVWLGTQIAMLPARIRVQEHDGKVVDQVLVTSG